MGDNTCSLNFCQAGEKYISTETCLTESHLGWYLNYTERDRETLKLFFLCCLIYSWDHPGSIDPSLLFQYKTWPVAFQQIWCEIMLKQWTELSDLDQWWLALFSWKRLCVSKHLSIAVRWKSVMCVDMCMLCYMCSMLSLAPTSVSFLSAGEGRKRVPLWEEREKAISWVGLECLPHCFCPHRCSKIHTAVHSMHQRPYLSL